MSIVLPKRPSTATIEAERVRLENSPEFGREMNFQLAELLQKCWGNLRYSALSAACSHPPEFRERDLFLLDGSSCLVCGAYLRDE